MAIKHKLYPQFRLTKLKPTAGAKALRFTLVTRYSATEGDQREDSGCTAGVRKDGLLYARPSQNQYQTAKWGSSFASRFTDALARDGWFKKLIGVGVLQDTDPEGEVEV